MASPRKHSPLSLSARALYLGRRVDEFIRQEMDRLELRGVWDSYEETGIEVWDKDWDRTRGERLDRIAVRAVGVRESTRSERERRDKLTKGLERARRAGYHRCEVCGAHFLDKGPRGAGMRWTGTAFRCYPGCWG